MADTPRAARVFLAAVWAVALGLLFLRLGYAPLTDVDEGAFAEATREMLARGDWVSPWLLDQPRFDKPALIHWLQMAGIWLLGLNAWGARLPSAVAGLIWVGAIGWWARLVAQKLWPQNGEDLATWAQAWAMLLAVTSLGIPAIARAATADATLNAFLVLTLVLLWQALWGTEQRSFSSQGDPGRRWARAAALCIALGLLTKGPIAVLVPGAAGLIATLWSGSLRRLLWLLRDPWSWFILAAVTTPWYLLQYLAQGQAFIDGFLGVHNVGRFTGTMHGFAAGPWYYPVWIMVATMPASGLVLAVLGMSLTRYGRSVLQLQRRELRLAWAVFVFVLVFFSFSATKLPHYGFYGLAGLMVLLAVALVGQLRNGQVGLMRLLVAVASLGVIGLGLLPETFAGLVARVTDPYHAVVLQAVDQDIAAAKTLFVFGGVLGAVLLVVVLFTRRGLAWMGLAACTVFAAFIHLALVPMVMHHLREPIWQAGLQVRSLPSDAPVYTWRMSVPSLSFAAQRVVPRGDPEPGRWLLVYAHHLPELQGRAPAVRLAFASRGMALVHWPAEAGRSP